MTYTIEKGTGSLPWHIVDGDQLVRRYRTKRTATLVLRVYQGDETAIDAMARSVLKDERHRTTTETLGQTIVNACWSGWIGVDATLSDARREVIEKVVLPAFGRVAVEANGGQPVTLFSRCEACPEHPYLGKMQREIERRFDGEKLFDVVVRECGRCKPLPIVDAGDSTPVVVLETAPEQPDPRKVVAFNLADLRERGVVQLSRPTSEAFGTELTWNDVERVTWREWARGAAFVLGCVEAWDKHTATPELIEAARRPLGAVWERACEILELPKCGVLDLREDNAGGRVLSSAWIDALAVALRKAERGIVLIVDFDPNTIARCLPSHVGLR